MFEVFTRYNTNCLFKVRTLRAEYVPATYDETKIIVITEHVSQQDILGNHIIIFI